MSVSARLHFTNLKRQDHQNGKAYVCMAINYFMRRNEFDHGYYIDFTGSKLSINYLYNQCEL